MCFYGQRVETGTVYTESLPDGADGRKRGIRWVPLGDGYACDGAMTVTESGRGKDRHYLVMETVCDRGFEGRGFAVRRTGTVEPYFCFVAHAGHDHCSCAHGTYRPNDGPCVHVLGVRAVLENGWLPDPHDNPLFGNPVNPEDAPF